MLKYFLAIVVALVWAVTAASAPLSAYGRLPAMSSVKISADGQKLAYIRNEGLRSTIVVQHVGGAVIRTVEMGARKVRAVQWIGDENILIQITETTTVADMFYAGEFALGASLNIVTGEAAAVPKRTAMPVANVLFGANNGRYEGKPVIYAALFARSAASAQNKDGSLDLYRIDPNTGIGQLQQRGDYTTGEYLFNFGGEVLARSKYDRPQSRWSLDLRKDDGWREALTVQAAIDTPDIVGRSLDEQAIILNIWDEDANSWRLRPFDLAQNKLMEPIGDGDVGYVRDNEHRVIAYWRDGVLRDYDMKEPRLAAGWALVSQAFAGRQLTLASFTPDYSKLVVYVEGTGEAGGFYLADLVAGKIKRIGGAYPELASADIGSTSGVKYKAADGLEISGYLTLPPGKAAKGLPLIVLPHGGPQSRDTAGFDWIAQGLASRGYAVLQPNFRGSTGYGQAFIEAGYGEWGGKMQTDLSDGVRALAKAGTIDPKRVCIAGASYGGYAALAGITMDRGVYRCAVAIAGVSDLSKMLEKETLQSGANGSVMRYWKRYMGVAGASDPKLTQRSPANFAAQADGPVLLIHGKDDTVVYYDQSTTMRDALNRAGKAVELVSLSAEDHYLSREATRQQTLAAMAAFLEQNNPPN